ncbi:MAG TPA: cation transporter [Trueperaceae bacterium]|nr:cation transporter [Trueperaceae bacterium]
MTKLNVTGMTCGHCQNAVKNALEEVTGVETAQVDLENGTATVAGAADVSALLAAVQEAGYEATVAA